MNVPPEIDAADDSVAITELADGDPNENNTIVTATGVIDFTDRNLPNTHDASAVLSSAIHSVDGAVAARGTLTPALIDDAAGDGSGAISWTFEVADAALEDLADGETLIQVYDIVIDDLNGGQASQTVTITLTGTNDAPAAVDVTISTTENATQSALLGGSDPDADDDQGSLVYTVEADPALGTLQFDGSGQATFDPGNDFDGLADGEVSVQTVTYYATDQHGAESGRASIRIEVTGENDAPVAGNINATTNEDDGPFDITLLGDDVDSDDDVSGLSYIIGDLNGNEDIADFQLLAQDPQNLIDIELFTFDASTDYQHLSDGQQTTATFEYVSVDSHGLLSDVATISIDITGENDLPVLDEETSDLDEVLFNDEGEVSVTGVIDADDIDTNDMLSYFIDNAGVLQGSLDGQFGTLQVNQGTGNWTYDLFAMPDFSGSSGVEEETFTIAASDGMATDTADLTVTILVDITELL